MKGIKMETRKTINRFCSFDLIRFRIFHRTCNVGFSRFGSNQNNLLPHKFRKAKAETLAFPSEVLFLLSTMKCSIFVSVLLTVVSPLSTIGANYDCKVDGNYDILDDPDDPLLPTTSEQAWAADKLKTSYNAVHSVYNDDFSIDTISVLGFDYDPAQLEVDNSKDIIDARFNLRGIEKLRDTILARWVKWRMKLRAKNKVGCWLCSNWDDDDAMRVTVDLDATETHSRWEAAWCDELQQGGVLVYEYATDCTIDLYDCTLIPEQTPKDNASNIPGTMTVGAGMEEIQTEAVAEITAQQMNEA